MPSCVGTIISLTFEYMDFGISCSYPHLVQTSSVKITYLDTYSWHRLEIEHNVQLFLLYKHELSINYTLYFICSVGKEDYKRGLD